MSAIAPSTSPSRFRAGWLAAIVIASLYAGLALTIDFPATAGGFQGDEATYYVMGQSLAYDHDLAYRRVDLERVYRDFGKDGPSGIFLKQGRTITGVHVDGHLPFVHVDTTDDPDPGRLYFGKAFIYPALAAPFVRLFGSNGFLVLNALLLIVSFLAAYAFLSARSNPAASLLLSSAFIFATVVPVYFIWVAPELLNFTLGLLAYYFWLYKEVATDAPPRGFAWERQPWTDVLAGALIGIGTFSKVTNVLLLVPMVLWLAWKRRWRQAILASVACAVLAGGLFAVNLASSGEWNYQGGHRNTFTPGTGYPFQSPTALFTAGAESSREGAMWDELFDAHMFPINLRANLEYYFVGRNGGLLPYFFPAVFGILALLTTWKRRASWQWFVFGAFVLQMLAFIIVQPYTYIGSGGTVGNRYFMGAYGACLFLLPPIESVWLAVVPWLVGGLFVGKIVLNSFYSSAIPWEHMNTGPLRWLPVEQTNINDIPLDADMGRRIYWYGNNTPEQIGFQIYYLDDNAYLKEGTDTSKEFWVRGESRAELLIKSVAVMPKLRLELSAGPKPTTASATVNGVTKSVTLNAGETQTLEFDLGPAFPYKKTRAEPVYEWIFSVSSSTGFTPKLVDPASPDVRYLGVKVKPSIGP